MTPGAPDASVHLLYDRLGRLDRVALMRQGTLTALSCDRIDRPALAGALVAARVLRVAGALRAAFVALDPAGTTGMLSLGNGPGAPAPRVGDRLLVQVKADPTQAKAARVATDIALPGRFLVLTPGAPGLRLSRRLGRAPALRQRLATVLPQAGWIVRQRAATAAEASLQAEAERLQRTWQAAATAFEQGGEGLLLAAPGPLARAVLDGDGPEDDPAASPRLTLQRGAVAAGALAWCRAAAPEVLAGLEPPGGVARPFDEYGLEDRFAALLAPTVAVPGGSTLTLERTRALTVIDIDGGESGNREAVNRAALTAAAVEIRLRNLSGTIVIDALNLPDGKARARLLAHLSSLVAKDPTETTVHGLTRLGLIELSRPRRTPSLDELLTPGWDTEPDGRERRT